MLHLRLNMWGVLNFILNLLRLIVSFINESDAWNYKEWKKTLKLCDATKDVKNNKNNDWKCLLRSCSKSHKLWVLTPLFSYCKIGDSHYLEKNRHCQAIIKCDINLNLFYFCHHELW